MGKIWTVDEIVEKKGYDPWLLERIQPQGGIKFKEDKFIALGTGYIGCIHVYEYPKELDTHWMAKLTNKSNTVATIDVHTDNVLEVKKNINRSMKEQDARYKAATDFSEQYDAEQRYNELKAMFHEISSMGEVVKLIHTRIFVSGHTWFETEEEVTRIIKELEADSYRSAIFLNEEETEWRSLYRSYAEQEKHPFQMIGQPIISEALAGGYPFHFSSLSDPFGTLMGVTPCGGTVLFDEFHKTKRRLHYNSLVVGTMSSGKSTTLKNRFQDRVIRGDFIRCFDISGEFTKLTNYYGGKVLRMDGPDGAFNPLEILRSGETQALSYSEHIAKLRVTYKFWMPQAEEQALLTFEELLRELYVTWGLIPKDGEINRQITGLPSKEYPILSDLLDLLERKINAATKNDEKMNDIEKAITIEELKYLIDIRRTIKNICDNYGMIFNKHTSFDNIQDVQIVTFDLSSIKNLKEPVFDAMLFQMITLCWDNAITNGSIMKCRFEENEVAFWDVIHTLIIIDEAHRIINARKLQALHQINTYLREGRKYFAGMILASQSIRDFAPENSSDEAVGQLRTLFGLMQYKFIFRQDSDLQGLIGDLFGNQLKPNEIAAIPMLEQGDCILNIVSDQNLQITIGLTKEEEKLFSGGV